MEGCDSVLHVASPLGGSSSDRDALVEAARGGTLRVLRAATHAGVKRVVFTSAAAAARPPLESGRESDESVWADPADPQFDAYRVSKILAERAAWDFMASAASPTTLATILPGAVFGPVLASESLGSVAIVRRFLDGKPPAIPRLGFSVVDVRDLAALHVNAMTAPDAAGERFSPPATSCGWRMSRASCDRVSALVPIGCRPAGCRTSSSAPRRSPRPTCARWRRCSDVATR